MTLELQFARIEWTPAGETTTVIPIAPSGTVVEYLPSSPRRSVTQTAGALDGAWPVAHRAENVVETFALSLLGTDPYSGLRIINQALNRALEWAEGFRPDMRMVIRIRDSARHADFFEARLFGGSVTLERGPMLRLTVERFPFWDGAEELLQVKNRTTGDVLADYATITNRDDADPAHANYVIVEAPDGDAPTPMHIRINNSYATGRLGAVRMGWYDRPNNLILEGEDSELAATITPDTAYSNNAYGSAQYFRWSVPHSTARDLVGPFRVFAAGALDTGTWRFAAGYELTRQQYASRAAVAGARGLTELGEIMLPPGGYIHPTRGDVRFWLDGSDNGALDYVVFMPVMQYRHIFFEGYNALPGTCIDDDGWRGELAYEAGVRYPMLAAYGVPIKVWPELLLPGAQEQMIVFALENDVGRAEAERGAQVQVFARPRYEVLP